MAVKPIPDDYHTITPYLIVPRVADLIAFLKEAFDAREVHRMLRPDGTLMHAEVRIGNSAVMMGEPTSELGPMPSSLYLYVEDCDAVYQRAKICALWPYLRRDAEKELTWKSTKLKLRPEFFQESAACCT